MVTWSLPVPASTPQNQLVNCSLVSCVHDFFLPVCVLQVEAERLGGALQSRPGLQPVWRKPADQPAEPGAGRRDLPVSGLQRLRDGGEPPGQPDLRL